MDNYSGKVGVRATAFWGASAAQAQVGTAGNFNQSGYYVIWCDINYVAKFSKTLLAIATLHANLFADGVKYTDDFLGADPVWPWQRGAIRTSRVGRGEHEGRLGGIAPDLVDRRTRAELSGTESLDEVTAAGMSGVLHRGKHPVERGVAARHAL